MRGVIVTHLFLELYTIYRELALKLFCHAIISNCLTALLNTLCAAMWIFIEKRVWSAKLSMKKEQDFYTMIKIYFR